jgi:hypothetical protein
MRPILPAPNYRDMRLSPQPRTAVRGFTVIEAFLMLVALLIFSVIAGGLWRHYQKTGSMESKPQHTAPAGPRPAVIDEPRSDSSGS